MAAFYREDGIGLVMHVLSINFFPLPFGPVSMAIPKRNLTFDKVVHQPGIRNAAGNSVDRAVLDGVGFIGLALGCRWRAPRPRCS